MKSIFTALFCLLLIQWSMAQELTVSGKVVDSQTNEPLAGVLVKSTEAAASTYTDVFGGFKLSVKNGYEAVTFSLEGYKTVEILLNGRTTIDVSLGTDSKESSETWSPTQLSSGDLGTQPVTDLEQSAQGRAAGVFIQNSGGKLGEGTKVRIRGGSSLTGSNSPLYVVDGVPLTSGNQSDIDPSTVASMEILKDASATALYGSRAANGVVLITTKKGQSGLNVDVEYQMGISDNPRRMDLMDKNEYNLLNFEYTLRAILAGIPDEDISLNSTSLEDIISHDNLQKWYSDLETLSSNNPGGQISYDFPNGDKITMSSNNPIFRYKYNTDWQDEIFRTAVSNRANVNISGGSAKQRVFGNVNYLDQEGILIGNTYERLGGRFNLTSDWTDKLSSSLSLGVARINNHRVNEDTDDGNPVQMALLPPGDESDPSNHYILKVRSLEYNPQTEIYDSRNFEGSTQVNGNASLGYSITNDLSFNVDGGVDYLDLRDERRQGVNTQNGKPTGFSRLSTSNVFNYLVNASLDYSKEVAGNQLSAIVGTSYQKSNSAYTFRSARVNSISVLESLNSTNSSLINNLIPGSAFAFLSFYGSVGYNIQDKYDFNVTARADGSSRFSPDNRMGVFPAASVGWTLSNESFLEGNSTISFLKLNAGYGVLGNTPFDDFLYRTNYYLVNYDDGTGFRVSNMQNSKLKWESTSEIDLSLEFGLFSNRVNGSLNYYNKTTTDLLFPVPVSRTSGLSSAIMNTGQLTNTGLEFALNTINVKTRSVTWETSFNVASNRNNIEDIGGQTLISGPSAFVEGQSAGVFFLPEYVGVESATGDAQYSYINNIGLEDKTTDYNTAVNTARKVVGNPNPKLFGGITNNVSYKSITLNFMFQFVEGVDAYWESGEIIANSGYGIFNQTKDQVDRWYQPGDEAAYPRLNPGLASTNPSSRWVVDASYVRLKSLTLSYSLPSSLVDKMNLRYFSVYIGGQNLWTLTKYPGYDPDVSSDAGTGDFGANINKSIDYFTAPQPRTFTTGIKIGF